jgi:transcriptional regulator of nitric oxide reductase
MEVLRMKESVQRFTWTDWRILARWRLAGPERAPAEAGKTRMDTILNLTPLLPLLQLRLHQLSRLDATLSCATLIVLNILFFYLACAISALPEFWHRIAQRRVTLETWLPLQHPV